MAQEQPRAEGTPEPPPPPPGRKRLRKSATEKMIFGVAGGIAEYLDVDPILVRVIFVALVLGGGSGLLIYIILAIIMPSADSEATTTSSGMERGSPQQIIGVAIIILGAVLLATNLGWFSNFWRYGWPITLIALGVFIIVARSRPSR